LDDRTRISPRWWAYWQAVVAGATDASASSRSPASSSPGQAIGGDAGPTISAAASHDAEPHHVRCSSSRPGAVRRTWQEILEGSPSTSRQMRRRLSQSRARRHRNPHLALSRNSAGEGLILTVVSPGQKFSLDTVPCSAVGASGSRIGDRQGRLSYYFGSNPALMQRPHRCDVATEAAETLVAHDEDISWTPVSASRQMRGRLSRSRARRQQNRKPTTFVAGPPLYPAGLWALRECTLIARASLLFQSQ
jgi:hypothetical protein